MPGPQLMYYATTRAGRGAIIETSSGQIAAWIVHDGDRLRARRGDWLSEPTETISQLVAVVAEHFGGGRE